MKCRSFVALRIPQCSIWIFASSAAAFLACTTLASEAISVPGPFTYVQTFDGLGSATAPWVDDSTIPGWFAGINTNNTPDGDLQATNGIDAVPLSGLLNLGSSGAADRSLGSKATGTGNFANIAFGVVFQNTSAQPLIVTNITYTGELWRTNTTAGGLPEQWFVFFKTSSSLIEDVEPGTSGDVANPGSFTLVPALNWSSPTNQPEGSALDGNIAANRATVSANPNVNVNPGDYFMVRWVDTNRSGTDGYQGIDDVSISFSAATGTNLANLSTRLKVETGDNALIGGFIITGTQPKKVIVRAIGPSLSVAGKLANPSLELHDGSGALLASNDDWMNSTPADKKAIIDSGIPPANDLESAIVRTLPANGASYTAIVRGANNTTGIGVVEAYDLDRTIDSKLANISTRGLVQTGNNVLIAGTIVTGAGPQQVIIRAIGPSLPFAGTLADPTLELRDGNGGLLQANDNWKDSPYKQTIIDSGVPPGHDLESAIVAGLLGNGTSYTAIVRGTNDDTGIGVVEIYALLSGQAAITTPANGATVGSAFTIEATATTPIGSISSVSFYDGNTLLGTDTTFPYRFDWTNASVGSHALKVVAYDNNNNATPDSAIVNVTVVAGAGSLTRGPYLQKAAPTQMTIRWRNTLYNLGRVRYGASPASLDQTIDEPTNPTGQFDHLITLTGLTPNKTYYYSVGAGGNTLAPAPADNAADFTFTTPPVAGTVIDTRIWVLGDAGTAGNGDPARQKSVRDAFYTWTGAHTPNLVLQLGDNAYNSGQDTEFQKAMFDMFPTMLRKTVFWSCLGNHETAQATAFVDTYPYFDIYTLPTAGQSGGVASGTEHYYSFDYGNIHFISLDSMTANRAVDDPRTPQNEDGPMAAWLRHDLQSTTATWVIAFFHHPPYTKGSHNSDTESEHIQMRQNFLPILEAGGVDVVLGGHSHIYERSYLLDGHYGISTTLTPAMKVNPGDGRPAGNGAYLKPLADAGGHKGAVYNVAGSAGQISGTQPDFPHPAHFISLTNLGSLVLDINGNRLDATFVRENGTTPDTYSIQKQ
jgi:calcineurin-like phosphoesterase family protein/Big-like domain-containing protein/purple acid phosphatase-like protein